MKKQQLIAAALTVVVGLLVGSSTPAGEKDAKEKPRDDVLLKELRDLREEVAKLRLSTAEGRAALQGLNDKLDRIEKRLDAMAVPAPAPRQAFAFDPTPRGTIRLDNRLGVRAYVTIDGVTYPVAPLSAVELRDQPARDFTYEWTADGYGRSVPQRTRVAARERWTLTIY